MSGSEQAGWSDDDTRAFQEDAACFVPERETQIRILCDLVPGHAASPEIVDLCCGDGALSEALLERFPEAVVHGLDGSAAMLERAEERLARFGARFRARRIELADRGWRQLEPPPVAVVCSLAIHHLDGPGKRELFADLARALAPGGLVLIADLIEPTTESGRRLAARMWDEAVQRQALELTGDDGPVRRFREGRWNYYSDPDPDPVDQPSPLADQLRWLEAAGLSDVDVFWMSAGHAIFGGWAS